MQQLADATAPFGDIIALHNDHNFIPTISALALSTNDPFYDIAGDGNLLGLTEFDQVYFPADNQEHIDINAQNKAWFLAEIQLGIEVSTIRWNLCSSTCWRRWATRAWNSPTS